MMSHLELMTDQIYSPSPLISFLEVASPLSSCCCCSVTQSCPALADPMDCSTPAFLALQYLLDFAQTHVHQVRDAIQLSYPLLSLLLPALIFPSIRFFSNFSTLGIRWPEYWSFSFSISPYNEYSELIFLRIEWLDLLAVQGTQESSPAPHFKSINSLVLILLYGPALTSVHDNRQNHSFDYMDLCQQNDICFLICCLVFGLKLL